MRILSRTTNLHRALREAPSYSTSALHHLGHFGECWRVTHDNHRNPLSRTATAHPRCPMTRSPQPRHTRQGVFLARSDHPCAIHVRLCRLFPRLQTGTHFSHRAWAHLATPLPHHTTGGDANRKPPKYRYDELLNFSCIQAGLVAVAA